VWRAAELLGIADAAADAVEAEGLLELNAGIVFRHPLVRSAVYGAASAQERRQTHQALAEATDPVVDPRSTGLAPGPGGVAPRRGRRCRA